MIKKQVKELMLFSILAGASTSLYALDLSNDETLSPIGSEKAGNAAGTIPAYSGKAPNAPEGHEVGSQERRPSPYNDAPLFSITAENADQYAEQLDGMIEVFKKYPNYRMDIYPSHRDVEYPQYVLDNTQKNLTACKETAAGATLEGCYAGIPFPVPTTGTQVMWNHLLQFSGYEYASPGGTSGWIVTPSGRPILQTISTSYTRSDFYNPNAQGPHPSSLIYAKIIQGDLAPARKVGGVILIHNSLDTVNTGNRIYQYVPGQRRVKLAPDLAYDTPNPNSGGIYTMDDSKGFFGALDRYDFELAGKKEKFIMYNNFSMNDYKACEEKKIMENANFPHPDCVRWELHRVWQVDAKLKDGYRHVYPTRTFYWDEDAPGAGSAENYDMAGSLYRVSNNVTIPFYSSEKGANSDSTIFMDLQTGAWAASGFTARKGGAWIIAKEPLADSMFNPDTMAGSGLR